MGFSNFDNFKLNQLCKTTNGDCKIVGLDIYKQFIIGQFAKGPYKAGWVKESSVKEIKKTNRYKINSLLTNFHFLQFDFYYFYSTNYIKLIDYSEVNFD